jgi:hypothetical protein
VRRPWRSLATLALEGEAPADLESQPGLTRRV